MRLLVMCSSNAAALARLFSDSRYQQPLITLDQAEDEMNYRHFRFFSFDRADRAYQDTKVFRAFIAWKCR